MAQEPSLGWRPWAVGAAVIGLAMVAAYIAIIFGLEDNNSLFVVSPWILAMAIPALGAFASVVIDDHRSARAVLIGSAVVFTTLGLVSILTIGLGFLVAAMLAGVGAARSSIPDAA